MSDDELIAMARAARVDDRLSDGALYGRLADRIRALIAERDEAKGWAQYYRCEATEDGTALRVAEAEVARLRGLLREASGWLWAPEIYPGHPLPSIKARIDAALATEDTPAGEYPDDTALDRSIATAFREDTP